MDKKLITRIRELNSQLSPKPAGLKAKLALLPEVRAVVFDVYGTLFISASGDLGLHQEKLPESCLRQAFAACGVVLPEGLSSKALVMLMQLIQEEHREKKAAGIDFPEVEIREIWQKILTKLVEKNKLNLKLSNEFIARLAVEYECLSNPVWSMPGLREVLDKLHNSGYLMGIVSNAQFYTKLLFPAFLDHDLADLGFSENLCVWSYREGIAKPSASLYAKLIAQAQQFFGLEPVQILYIGNDMLNDIYPATGLGFRTALFAGEQRSLRLRETDSRCENLRPDLVITELEQLSQILQLRG